MIFPAQLPVRVTAEELRKAATHEHEEYKGALVLLALAQILERLETIDKNMACLSLTGSSQQ